jgi:hypothetical protein
LEDEVDDDDDDDDGDDDSPFLLFEESIFGVEPSLRSETETEASPVLFFAPIEDIFTDLMVDIEPAALTTVSESATLLSVIFTSLPRSSM